MLLYMYVILLKHCKVHPHYIKDKIADLCLKCTLATNDESVGCAEHNSLRLVRLCSEKSFGVNYFVKQSSISLNVSGKHCIGIHGADMKHCIGIHGADMKHCIGMLISHQFLYVSMLPI